jgi:hypothetical protein
MIESLRASVFAADEKSAKIGMIGVVYSGHASERQLRETGASRQASRN